MRRKGFVAALLALVAMGCGLCDSWARLSTKAEIVIAEGNRYVSMAPPAWQRDWAAGVTAYRAADLAVVAACTHQDARAIARAVADACDKVLVLVALLRGVPVAMTSDQLATMADETIALRDRAREKERSP